MSLRSENRKENCFDVLKALLSVRNNAFESDEISRCPSNKIYNLKLSSQKALWCAKLFCLERELVDGNLHVRVCVCV